MGKPEYLSDLILAVGEADDVFDAPGYTVTAWVVMALLPALKRRGLAVVRLTSVPADSPTSAAESDPAQRPASG